ncbi:MAG: Dabb family protein [Mycobacterium sp.]
MARTAGTSSLTQLMAFTHVVTFKWRDDGFDSGGIATALRALAADFDGVQSYRCGADAGFSPGAYDFAVVGTFDDPESFTAYRDHPEHQRILNDMILPNLAVRTVVQLQD